MIKLSQVGSICGNMTVTQFLLSCLEADNIGVAIHGTIKLQDF